MRITVSRAALVFALTVVAAPVMARLFMAEVPAEPTGAIAATGLALALFFAGVVYFMRADTAVSLPRPMLLTGGVIILACAASSVSTHSLERTLFGVAMEPDTAAYIALFTLALLCGAIIAHRYRDVLGFSLVLAPILVAIVTLLSFVFSPDLVLHQAFSSINTALLIAGALVFSALTADARQEGSRMSYMLATVILAALFYFTFARESAVLVLLAGSLGAAVLFARTFRFPWRTILVMLFVVIALLARVESPLQGVSNDARPSAVPSLSIASVEYSSGLRQAFLGSGPNTFDQAWEKYRPAAFNDTPLWSVTPEVGYSTAATLAVTLGVSGMLAFAFYLVQLAYVSVRGSMFTSSAALSDAIPYASLALLGILSAIVYAASGAVLFYSALAAGVAWRMFSTGDAGGSPETRTSSRVLQWSIGALCIVSALPIGGVSLKQVSAAVLYSRDAPAAADMWGASVYEREASRAFFEQAQSAASRGDVESMRVAIDAALRYATLSTISDPQDFKSWLNVASLNTAVADLGYEGAIDVALDALAQSKQLAPARPDVFYQEALLLRSLRRDEDAHAAARRALELKADYEPAASFLAES